MPKIEFKDKLALIVSLLALIVSTWTAIDSILYRKWQQGEEFTRKLRISYRLGDELAFPLSKAVEVAESKHNSVASGYLELVNETRINFYLNGKNRARYLAEQLELDALEWDSQSPYTRTFRDHIAQQLEDIHSSKVSAAFLLGLSKFELEMIYSNDRIQEKKALKKYEEIVTRLNPLLQEIESSYEMPIAISSRNEIFKQKVVLINRVRSTLRLPKYDWPESTAILDPDS